MRRDLPTRRNQERGISFWNEPDFFGSPGIFSGSPWQMMRRMQEDMDRVFGQFFGGETGQGGGALAQTGQMGQMGQQWAPSVDISRTDREWCIEADLPGVEKDNIDVQVRDHHLILRAEMRQEEPPQGEGEEQRRYARRERRYGFFERVVPLPENVDEEQIRCEFRNGVLTVRIPATGQEQQQARRLPVTEGGGQPAMQAGGRGAATRAEGRTGGEQLERGRATEEEEEEAMAGAKGGETGGRKTRGKKS